MRKTSAVVLALLWAVGAQAQGYVRVGHAEADKIAQDLSARVGSGTGTITNSYISTAFGVSLVVRHDSVIGLVIEPAADNGLQMIQTTCRALTNCGHLYDRTLWVGDNRGNPIPTYKVDDLRLYEVQNDLSHVAPGYAVNHPGYQVYADTLAYVDSAIDPAYYEAEFEAIESYLGATGRKVIWATLNCNKLNNSNTTSATRINVVNTALVSYAAAHGKVIYDTCDIESHEPLTGTACLDIASNPVACASMMDSTGNHPNTSGRLQLGYGLIYTMMIKAGWDGSTNGSTILPPTAPSGLSAGTPTSSGVTLTWSDNSSNESQFNVYRSTPDNTHYAQVGLATANSPTFPDSGLSPSTVYYYKVTATNGCTTPPCESAYSNEVNITTAANTEPLIVWYKMDDPDEITNTTLHDSSANGVGGSVLGNVGYSLDHCQGVGSFDFPGLNANTWVSAGYGNVLSTVSSALSISVCVKPYYGTGANQTVSHYNGAWKITIQRTATNTPVISVTTSSSTYSVTCPTRLTLYRWHQLGFVWGSNLLTAYQDGLPCGSISTAGTITIPSGGEHLIGVQDPTDSVDGEPYCVCRIDDLRIYNDARTAAQMQAIWAADAQATSTGFGRMMKR